MNQLLMAIIDSNEPAWAKALKFGGIPTQVKPLDAGDYLLACSDGATVLVERKAPDDLLGTIGENRLFDQVARCRASTEWAYLLITGELRSDKDGKVITPGRGSTGWDITAVWGALQTVQEMGVIVTFCKADSHLEDTLINLAKRDRGAKVVMPRRESIQLTDAQKIIMALPGMGPELQEALQAYAGKEAFWQLIAVSDPDTAKEGIPGIGKGRISQWRDALGLYPGMKLSLVDEEQKLMLTIKEYAENGR